MARTAYQLTIAPSADPAAVVETVCQLLLDRGFQEETFKNEHVWVRKSGKIVLPQYLKLELHGYTLTISAWMWDSMLKLEMSLKGIPTVPMVALLKTIRAIRAIVPQE